MRLKSGNTLILNFASKAVRNFVKIVLILFLTPVLPFGIFIFVFNLYKKEILVYKFGNVRK